MYILAIETTGAFASVALMQDDKVLGHIQGGDRFSHLQNLMPQIDKVTKDNKLSINDIEVIAVSHGPGSFTGIRIGVATARALSQILNIPCVEVSSLEALTLRSCKENVAGKLICPILDARRSQVYGGGYYINDGELEETVKAGPYTIDEFMEAVSNFDDVLFMGDGIDTCGEKILAARENGVEFCDETIRYQDAVTVAQLGAKLLAAGKGKEYNDVQPEYMRIAEAERKLKEQQAQEKK